MKSKNNDFVTSRKTPDSLIRNTNTLNNMFLHMFMEDITHGFSYDFSSRGSYNDIFYTTSDKDKLLEQYLCYESYHYMRYDFEKILTSSLYDLIFFGRAYAELILLKDDKGDLKGLEFLPIKAKRLFNCFKVSWFAGKNYEKKLSLFHVPNKYIISYDLKELGYKRNHFKKRFRKLKKLDITVATNLMLSSDMKKHFDSSTYVNKKERDKITVFSDIGWIGRDYDNKNMSESYFLYQRAKYLNFKWKMLQYLLKGVNESIKNFASVLNTSASITVTSTEQDYFALFDKYVNEEITADELSNELIKV